MTKELVLALLVVFLTLSALYMRRFFKWGTDPANMATPPLFGVWCIWCMCTSLASMYVVEYLYKIIFGVA